MPPLPWQPPTDRQQRSQIYLVCAMVFLAILNTLPGIVGLGSGFQPVWSRASMLIGLWSLGLAAWVTTVPDWISLRVATWTHAALAAFYCGLTALVLTSPGDRQLPWDLQDVRSRAIPWCAGMTLFTLLTAYAAGAAATRWRKQVRKSQAN